MMLMIILVGDTKVFTVLGCDIDLVDDEYDDVEDDDEMSIDDYERSWR